MNAMTWILIVIGAIVVAAVVNGRARRARGSIELSLPTTHFGPGDTVRGQVTVHAKQAFEAERLTVTLTATETTETVKDGKPSSTSKQAFRDERELEGARPYAAGDDRTLDFEIPLPEAPPPEPPESHEPHEPHEPKLGKAAFGSQKTTKTALRPTTTSLSWRLSVRLAAKGVDLGTARTLDVDIERL